MLSACQSWIRPLMLQPSVTLLATGGWIKWTDVVCCLCREEAWLGGQPLGPAGERGTVCCLKRHITISPLNPPQSATLFTWWLFIRLGTYTSSSLIQKQDFFKTRYFEQLIVSTNACPEQKESCKCCLLKYANHSSQRELGTKQKDAYK